MYSSLFPEEKAFTDTVVPSGNLTLMVSDSVLPCRSVGGTYEMGGRIASCPFSHSESFRLSVDLVLLIV
jgi:hypothetical protein